MKTIHLLLLSLCSCLLLSCNDEPEETTPPFSFADFMKEEEEIIPEPDFPEPKNIANYPNTRFVPTLENTFSKKGNTIYAASLGLAWDTLRKGLAVPITQLMNPELKRIHESSSYQNVLAPDEYTASFKIEDFELKASASFEKMLPFQRPLKKNNHDLIFLGEAVESFGFDGEHQRAEIIYYKNDNDFALQLSPRDDTHKIILVKTSLSRNTTFKDEVERLHQKKNDFWEAKTEQNSWKYRLENDDIVSIPCIAFHLSYDYPEIVGSSFFANQSFTIQECYQKTAFVLNEEGAKVMSSVILEGVESFSLPERERPQPKKLIFDQSFFIFLQKTDSEFPYFSMLVSNTDFMEHRQTD